MATFLGGTAVLYAAGEIAVTEILHGLDRTVHLLTTTYEAARSG